MTQVKQYSLINILGQGGIATTYAAENNQTQAPMPATMKGEPFLPVGPIPS